MMSMAQLIVVLNHGSSIIIGNKKTYQCRCRVQK